MVLARLFSKFPWQSATFIALITVNWQPANAASHDSEVAYRLGVRLLSIARISSF